MSHESLPNTRTALRSSRKFVLYGLAALSVWPGVSAVLAGQQAGPALATLRREFLNPPHASRPMVRWWWFGPAVVKPEILRELRQMKVDGIQGAELAFVYPEVLDDRGKGLKNLPFLSPEMLEDVRYAQAEARKLGLRIDVTLGTGWPYGGPAITLADAVTRLRIVEVSVPANSTSVTLPALGEGESLIWAAIVNSLPAPMTGGNTEPGKAWDAASAEPLTVSGAIASTGTSRKPRTALFFVQSHTRQMVKRAAVGGEGYVLDPFSHEAVATHLKTVGEPLISAFSSAPPYAVFSDSLEAYGADWTPDLPAEFSKRRGYDLIPHLAELAAGGSIAADTVRHDYGKTLTELIDENYLTQMNDWAIAHRTKFRSQTYGDPAVSFSSQKLAELAEGEGPKWRAFSTLRWATSANHVFDRTVSSGETFTWLHSPVFRATPLDMKAEADIDFIMGENQIICHGWPYSAPDDEVPEPGWSLYAAASFNDHNPWHPVMPAVTAYIGRMSYLLRQGKPANQVAILLPTDDAWAGFRPGKTSVTAAMANLITPALMSTILSAGYNIDYIDAEALEEVGLGTHSILILPPTDRIPLIALRKIAAFVAAGGKVIAIGRAPSIDPEGRTVAELTGLSKRLFNPAEASFVPEEAHLADALQAAQKPDFELLAGDIVAHSELGFIRRTLPGADLYFVANTSNRTVDTVASFATAHRYGEAWDTDTASVSAADAHAFPLHLEPYESRVFVFSDSVSTAKPGRQRAGAGREVDISTGWTADFPAIHRKVLEAVLTDWISDPSTLHYSGEAIYSRDVSLTSATGTAVFLELEGGKALPGPTASLPEHPALGPDGLPNPLVTGTGPGMRAYYDPPIREAALVVINGQPAGALWHPPYRLEVTKLLKPGLNHIEIRVFNTALNAWSALPARDYAPLTARYGNRFQMQDLDQVVPISSGLLGRVRLVVVEFE